MDLWGWSLSAPYGERRSAARTPATGAQLKVVSMQFEEEKPGEALTSLPEAQAERRGDIPPETWAALSRAGHSAAQRLLELIEGRGWASLKPGDKARLIELALTRAYGPPVQRTASLELRGTVSDAVADSLARLSAIDLPETGDARSGAVTGAGAPRAASEGSDPLDLETALQTASQRRRRAV